MTIQRFEENAIVTCQRHEIRNVELLLESRKSLNALLFLNDDSGGIGGPNCGTS